jgi:PKD repeat protein
MKKQLFSLLFFALFISCETEKIKPLNPFFEYTEGTEGNVQFYDKSTGDILFYEWDFGDGQKSNDKNPSHKFPRNNDYPVKLTVRGRSNEELIIRYIRVANYATTGRFSFFTKVASAGFIDFYVNGAYEGRLTKYFTETASDPTCGVDGTFTITRPAGTYSFSARSTSGINWSGNFTIVNGQCRLSQLVRSN